MDKIICPNCNYSFDIEGALAKDLEEKFRKQILLERAELQKGFDNKLKNLDKERKDFEEKKQQENKLFKERLEKAVVEHEKILKTKIKEDFELVIASQNREIEEMREKTKQLQLKDLEIQRMRRKMEDLGKDLEIELQKKLFEQTRNIEEKAKQKVRSEMDLKLLEKEKQLEDQRKLIEEMKRKSEQGSMQLQGEVQEMAIESYLIQAFPFDKIDEIKKGARGGDCIQIINTPEKMNCGTIYYESKRTKDFQPMWIEKFKKDMREKGADIGVIVTQAMPKEMDHMGEKQGVWICSFEEFKSLAHILRAMVIKVAVAAESQENKGHKIELLYDYINSNEFKMRIEAIVDGFTKMQMDLVKEKNAMARIWSEREKQLQKAVENTIAFYGGFKGIAGNAIPQIDTLELPGS